MARQGYKEISIEVPEGWEDKTVVVFAAPPRVGKGSQPNVVLTRDTLPAGTSLRTFASKELSKIAQSLKGFELIETKERNIDNALAVEHHFSWEGQAGQVVQRILFLEREGTIHNVTVSAARADAQGAQETFERIIASVVVAPKKPGLPRASA